MKTKRLGIFASGTGSNALNLIRYFEGHPKIQIAFVLCNNAHAPVVDATKKLGVPVEVISNQEAALPQKLIEICKKNGADYIILAGYLRLIPGEFIQKYPEKIINVHPSLLPKFGGKGMYGRYVHEAVLEANEVQSGISIHLVNEVYDEGRLIAQYSCDISENENLESLQKKIHALEMHYFPKTIESFINQP
ncbi:MAG: phosphoribosylglycinamide formyltransferase [Bacteroidetes bacterium]|nr:MAG: phosphoribosylglycinamide formyltransferase [Bacteroidota bacterium]